MTAAATEVAAVVADDTLNALRRIRPLIAYDEGLIPPPRPTAGPRAELIDASIDDVIKVVTDQCQVLMASYVANRTVAWTRKLLGWLAQFPGESWEARWLACGADAAPRSWADVPAAAGVGSRRDHVTPAMAALLMSRVLRPSYSWLLNSRLHTLYERFTAVNDPDDFARLRTLPAYQVVHRRHQGDAEAALIRVMIRTGKPLMRLTGEDLLTYADRVATSGRVRREHLAWELMVALGPFAGEPPTLRAVWTSKGNTKQHTAAGLVARYRLPPSGVRDLLVDYLGEIRPGLDYRSWESLGYKLCHLFWHTVLAINPDQTDLRLTPQVATAWHETLLVTKLGQPRRDRHGALIAVRAFYRDIGQWALEDPARWARWAAPSPVRDLDVRSMRKARRQRQARMQQRTRTLTPLLPKLVATANARRSHSAQLLAAASDTPDGEPVGIDNAVYVRDDPPPRGGDRNRRSRVWVRDATGTRLDVSALEADCFWAWALIETLRLTGARIEEVLEITQLSLRHYTPPTTGALVPLLHIAPSKLDIERLIPMSPELVDVILAVQRRAKAGADTVPLSIRCDPLEKTHGEPLPHLFARPVGARHEVLSNHYIRTILNATARAAELADNGEPIHFAPHDFRRLFTTDVVGAGLPLHIAAALLGHLDLDTTRGYTAVFQDELIARHQQFITRRRALRDSAEYRDVTTEEWAEFEKHFQLRRVALGDCFRPYGTPCVHEHACIRCPHLRLDPNQTPLLDDIETNTQLRLTEASEKGWLGEVAALEETLHHIGRKRTQFPATG